MFTRTDKTSDNKSSITHTNSGTEAGRDDTFTFDDQRPEAIAQRKLVDMMQSRGAVTQLQEKDDIPKPEEPIAEDQETEQLPDDDGTLPEGNGDNFSTEEYIHRLMTSYDEEIDLFEETHHLERHLVEDEYVLGVASDWNDLSAIHVQLRQLGTSQNWKNLWIELKEYRKEIKRLGLLVRADRIRFETFSDQYRNLGKRFDPYKKVALRKKSDAAFRDMDRHQTLLDAEIRKENRAAREFIELSAQEFSTETAEILGAKMPKVSYDSDVAPADANNVRYHTGDINDPIPITWYKPAGSYNNIQVTDQQTNLPVTLQPFGANAAVQDSKGKSWTFGAAANQITTGTDLYNMPKHGKSRKKQQELNKVLADLGYNMAGEDGDHVKDLGFGGNDVIGNYWPLDSTTNRYAFTGWRSTYHLNFKTGDQDENGKEIVRKAALNSGDLIGKYVRVVAEEATNDPTGNNTSASGSDRTWGNQETIVDKRGNQIPEG